MSLFDRIANQTAVYVASKIKIPPEIQSRLPLAKALLTGNFQGAADAALDELFEKFGPVGLGSRFPRETGALRKPSQLLGGITLKKAREIYAKGAATNYAKKNLFCIFVGDAFSNSSTGFDFNFFATEVSYAPISVSGDAVRVGSGSFDTIQNSERVDMRITTLDDAQGTVKRWFKERHDLMCHTDATFGLPSEYLLKVAVMHAFIGTDVKGAENAYIDTYIMRPGTIEYDLSRRDDALQELQMTLTQWDTFAAIR